MHKVKPNLTDLPEWRARVFVMKMITGKLDQKATKGCWPGYRGTSKGHCIYGANKSILIEQNVTFNNSVLTIPDTISIVGEYKHELTQKTSNQNMMIQSLHKEPKPHKPSADIITPNPSVIMDLSTDRVVDDIVKDLENAPSQQPLRQSERLNPPTVHVRNTLILKEILLVTKELEPDI